MARHAVVLALVLAVLGAPRVHACESCPVPGGELTAPTAACQSMSGETTDACTARAYTVDLIEGSSYTFTLCDQTCPTADADFDTLLRLWSPSCVLVAENDDSCGSGRSELVLRAAESGPHVIEVTGSELRDVGRFTLGWFGECRDFDCADPLAVLEPPTTACRTVAGSMSCGDANSYAVTLVQGQAYTFTLCEVTCAAAFADFDSSLELIDPAGVVVASSTASCGDDGELVFETDPLSGGGTHCVRVGREAGQGDYALAYRVACQPPSEADLTPSLLGLTEANCAIEQGFVLTSSGTGPFEVEWSIDAPAGGSAVPAAGIELAPVNSTEFGSLLTGAGVFRVSVTLTNDCGTLTQVFPVLAEDRRAPDLAVHAAVIECGAPFAPAPAPRSAGRLSSAPQPLVTRTGEPDRVMLERMAAIKASAAEVEQPPFGGPVFERPPEADALACAAPCEVGVLEADQAYYDVFLNCATGNYTARTGVDHPVTAQGGGFPQNVIFGGAGGSPGTSDLAFFVHDFALMYQNPAGGRACLFDPPDTAAEPASVGIEQEWVVQPDPDVELLLRQEVVAFGTSENDSGVRLTLGIENATESRRVVSTGVRWQIDYQNAGDDGPLFATVACDPPSIQATLDVEHELAPSEVMDFYRIQNNTGAPIFGNFTNTTALAGFPDTGTPDRLVYGYWGSMRGSAWDRPAIEGSPNVDGDSAVHYWFGHDMDSGIVLAPGESFRRSVVIFTSGESVDCGGFVPGEGGDADLQVCAGDCVELSATASDGCGLSEAVPLSWTPGAPPCAGSPCEVEFDAAGDYTYVWEATDESGNATQATTTVRVLDAADCGLLGCEPSITGPPADQRICVGDGAILDAGGLGLARCDGDLIYTWSDGTGPVGTDPVLEVVPETTTDYRVVVECSSDVDCFVEDLVTVAVDEPPLLETVSVRDPSDCALGLELSWLGAWFPNPSGAVFNVYRSEISCADALARAPIATGLTGTTWLDTSTQPGPSYRYVVEAEDGLAGSACRPAGPHHAGSVARACSEPAVDAGSFAFPDGVGATLFASHEGHAVSFHWATARALLSAEHFHLLKASDQPTNAFSRVNPEADGTREHLETDISSSLQFFDLRVANGCEDESLDEFPPTFR